MTTKLTDDSLMPWGKHKGKRLIDVPDDYLLWLYENDKCSNDVRMYIEDVLPSLIRNRDIKP